MSPGSDEEVQQRHQPASASDPMLPPRLRSTQSPQQGATAIHRPRSFTPGQDASSKSLSGGLQARAHGAANPPASLPLSPEVDTRLDQILLELISFKSMRAPHRKTIASRLESLPADKHMALLNGLRAELWGKNELDMSDVIGTWASRVSDETVVRPPEEDMRPPEARARMERLQDAQKSEEFRDKVDQINGLFTLKTRHKTHMRDTGLMGADRHFKYRSKLYRAVMERPEAINDPQVGGLRLITELHDRLVREPPGRREQVLTEWVPSASAPTGPSASLAPSSTPGSSQEGGAAKRPAEARKDFSIIYYRNFGTGDADDWRGAWSQVKAGAVDEATFAHPEAEESQSGEHSLAVKALHVKKQVGGEGHWSIFVETAPDSRMIKLDSVQKGYRVYVDPKRDEGAYETETYRVLESGTKKMTVKDVYDTMSKVVGEIGAWADTEEHNCRGFVNSMIGELNPSLSEPAATQVGRKRKRPERFDPSAY